MVENSAEQKSSNWLKVRQAVFGPSSISSQAKASGINPNGYNEKEDVAPKSLTHGIQKLCEKVINYASQSPIKKLVYNSLLEESIILFGNGSLCAFNNKGREVNYKASDSIISLIYCARQKNYVAVCDDSCIRVLVSQSCLVISATPDQAVFFECTSFSKMLPGNYVKRVVYNEYTDEVLSYGLGSIINWFFKSAGTLLVPKKIIKEQLRAGDSISCLCVESTTSLQQRCFASVRSSVFIYCIQSGDCVSKLLDIHQSHISHVLYYQPLKLLVTAGKDGIIKTWNSSWSLNSLFVGHSMEVTSLVIYPNAPSILSTSLDGSLRTWSLDTKDETACENELRPIFGLHCGKGDSFFTFTAKCLTTWKVYNLHEPFIILGSKGKILKTTTNQDIPPVSYSICDDGCVRIICSKTAKLVTTFLSPEFICIVDAEYHVAQNLLFVLLADGRLLKISTLTNPCTILQTWDLETTGAPANSACLCLYEYVKKVNTEGKRFADLVEQTLVKIQQQGKNNGTLLVSGCQDGHIVLHEWWKNGQVVFKLQAHRDEIVAMSANSVLNQLVTASKDLTLKIWRVFPFSEEALTPLLMFMHSHVATALVYSKEILGVVYEDATKSSYKMAIYNTSDVGKAKLIEHDISEDHIDNITSVATCSKLRLIATASNDRTVRIWNQHNELIRVLQLNDVVHSLGFCSERGDLLMGIGTNLHIVTYEKYLPKKYLYQMVTMTFNELSPIPLIECDESKLSLTEKKRVHKTHSSFNKLIKFVDEIPEEELRKRKETERIKEEEFALLTARDRELQLMKDGLLKSKKCHRLSQQQKDEAFARYLEIFYTRPSIDYPDDENLLEDNDNNFLTQIEAPYKPDNAENTGFFSIASTKTNLERIKAKLREERTYQIERNRALTDKTNGDMSPCGTRSPSIEIDTLGPTKRKDLLKHSLSSSSSYTERLQQIKKTRQAAKMVDCATENNQHYFDFITAKLRVIDATCEEYPYKDKTLQSVNKTLEREVEESGFCHEENLETMPLAPDGFLPNSVIVALYKELKREVDEEERFDKWLPRALTEEQLNQLAENESAAEDSTLNLPALVEQNPSRVMTEWWDMKDDIKMFEEDTATPPLTPSPSVTPEKVEEIRLESVKKPLKIIKPIVKLVTKPVIEKRSQSQPHDRSRPPSPPQPQPRPPSPLPEFLQHFAHADWFKALFPNGSDIPKTRWEFISVLLKAIGNTKMFTLKSKIVAALLTMMDLHTLSSVENDILRASILAELNLPDDGAPKSSNLHEAEYIRKCLNILISQSHTNFLVVVELMVQFILGSALFRQDVFKIFLAAGLQDPNEYFTKELYFSFDILTVEPLKQRAKLHDLCFDWLNSWSKKFKEHIKSLSGKVCRTTQEKHVKGNGNTDTTKIKNGKEKTSKKSVSFVPGNFVVDAANHVTPIDVINYFCEIKLQTELEQERKETLKKTEKEEKDKTEKVQRNKDAVLVLPNIEDYVSLVRIGETHRSICHPERETRLSRFCLPPIENKHGVHSLMLHLNMLTLNPFPDELDELVYAPNKNSDLITLRYAPKYFIPALSVVKNTNPCSGGAVARIIPT